MTIVKHRAIRTALAWAPLACLVLACGLGGSDDDRPPAPTPPVAAPPPVSVAPVPVPAPTPVAAQPPAPARNAPPRNLGCIARGAVDSSMTPVELYTSMAECARADRADDARFLFALGGVYGRFDTFRCAESSGHGAASIVRQGQIQSVPDAQWDSVRTLISQISDDPATLATMCAQLREVGAPTYYPGYMVRHGAMVFARNTRPPLVANFEPAPAWERALDTYIHCPAAAAP